MGGVFIFPHDGRAASVPACEARGLPELALVDLLQRITGLQERLKAPDHDLVELDKNREITIATFCFYVRVYD
jgi:hypothetical protein